MMVMTEEQEIYIANIQERFDTLWKKLCGYIPEIGSLFSKNEQSEIRVKYVVKLKALFNSQQESITSPCFFDDFISSCGNGVHVKDFRETVNCVGSTIKFALSNALSNPNKSVLDKIRQTIKDMIITMDENPASNNPDYRNRLNELLVFNWLNECENIKTVDVEYPLGNNKTCDFRCIHQDGSELLIEVVTIHNIDLSKQDNAATFSIFINQKIQKKYHEKLKGEVQIDKDCFRILPILDFVDNLLDFVPTLDYNMSLPSFTVVKNTIDDKMEFRLAQIEYLKTLKDEIY